jgi:hypothetical protein
MAMNSVVRSTAGPSRHIDRLLCGLRGHFMLRRFEPHKLSLHCALCGHESAGWEIGEPQPLPGAAERAAHNHRDGREHRVGSQHPEAALASVLGT